MVEYWSDSGDSVRVQVRVVLVQILARLQARLAAAGRPDLADRLAGGSLGLARNTRLAEEQLERPQVINVWSLIIM